MTEETNTAQILQKMKAQINALQEHMEAMQRTQPVDSPNSDEETEEALGSRLVQSQI